MKGKLFKIEVIQNVKEHTSERYESNDGRGWRQDSWTEVRYYATISELAHSQEWENSYWSKLKDVERLAQELSDSLMSLTRNWEASKVDYFIPQGVIPEWKVTTYKKIEISKDIYNLLKGVTQVEEKHFHKNMDVAYFYLHSGIRGKYLELFQVPGVERHGRHQYFDKYVEMADQNTQDVNPTVFNHVATLVESLEGQIEWDNRYIIPPSHPQEESTTALGDLLKAAGITGKTE